MSACLPLADHPAKRLCAACGRPVPYPGRGRPRTHCDACVAKRRAGAAARGETAPPAPPAAAPTPAAVPPAPSIEAYLPLVKHIARRLSIGLPAHIDLDDLAGWGVLGLLDAAEKFDPTRGFRFETYAFTRIRGAILDGLRQWDWAPERLRQRARLLDETRWSLASGLGRAPTVDEVAEATGLRRDVVLTAEAEADRSVPVSLDETWMAEGEGDRFSLCDLVPDPAAPDPADEAEAADLAARLWAAVDHLPPTWRAAVLMLYRDGLTPKEAAAALGLCVSRISQLHGRAIQRLRGMLERHRYDLGASPADPPRPTRRTRDEAEAAVEALLAKRGPMSAHRAAKTLRVDYRAARAVVDRRRAAG